MIKTNVALPLIVICVPVNALLSTNIPFCINLNFAIQINQKRDIVFTVSNIFTDVHGPWQYQERTNETDDDGVAITETTSAIWDKDAPIISASGIYFSIALRKINF